MEWWPFLIFHRGGLRIKVINNKRPLAETLSDFSQCPPFAIGQAQATLGLIPKNPILGHKIFVPQEKLLVHGS